VGNIALSNELGRTAITEVTLTGNSIEFASELGAGVGTGTLMEVGLLASTILFARARFVTAVPKTASDTIRIEWTITAT
jgi:hypothetical protein